jgi:hypothetical protein
MIEPLSLTVAPLLLVVVGLRAATERGPMPYISPRVIVDNSGPVKAPTSMAKWAHVATMTELTVLGTERPTTALVDRIADVLDSYAALDDGWDGDDSLAPTAAAIEAAKHFLKSLPFGVPFPEPMISSSGEPEFFWDLPTGYADARFSASGALSLFAKKPDGTTHYEEVGEPRFSAAREKQLLLLLLAPLQAKQAA